MKTYLKIMCAAAVVLSVQSAVAGNGTIGSFSRSASSSTSLVKKLTSRYDMSAVKGNVITMPDQGYCRVTEYSSALLCSSDYSYGVGFRSLRQIGEINCESGNKFFVLTPLDVSKRGDVVVGYPSAFFQKNCRQFENAPNPKVQ